MYGSSSTHSALDDAQLKSEPLYGANSLWHYDDDPTMMTLLATCQRNNRTYQITSTQQLLFKHIAQHLSLHV